MVPSPLGVSAITDLVNQWEDLVGHSIEVPDWAIQEMASHPNQYSSVYDVGQYMLAHERTGANESRPGGMNTYFVPEWYAYMPWAAYGLNSTQYDLSYNRFAETWKSLTGQEPDQAAFDRLSRQFKGQLTSGDLNATLMNDAAMQKQFGWLKYGLDYQQFTTQKLQMQQAFGFLPDDASAVAQLQYFHAAQGSDRSVSVQPTWSQQEKRQAQTGVGQSEVR